MGMCFSFHHSNHEPIEQNITVYFKNEMVQVIHINRIDNFSISHCMFQMVPNEMVCRLFKLVYSNGFNLAGLSPMRLPSVIHLNKRQTPGCWRDSKLFSTRSKQLSASWVFLANLGHAHPEKLDENIWNDIIYKTVYLLCIWIYLSVCMCAIRNCMSKHAFKWLLTSFKISKDLKTLLKN